jgi:hypothetical protein
MKMFDLYFILTRRWLKRNFIWSALNPCHLRVDRIFGLEQRNDKKS